MNCFTHRDIAAVGVCPVCGRFVCESCAVEVAGRIACRPSCQEAMKQVTSSMDLAGDAERAWKESHEQTQTMLEGAERTGRRLYLSFSLIVAAGATYLLYVGLSEEIPFATYAGVGTALFAGLLAIEAFRD